MPPGQFHAKRFHARMTQLNRQTASRSLATAIAVGVETDIDTTFVEPGQLGDLKIIEMRTQRRHGVVETGLPDHKRRRTGQLIQDKFCVGLRHWSAATSKRPSIRITRRKAAARAQP
jgi:hypothetical protein